MYYQNLINMKQNSMIRNREIQLLDEWLIRVPYRNRNSLNFMQFSIDEDINEEIALSLFISATRADVEVLSLYYNVVTDDRMQSLGIYASKNEIPEVIYDYDSGEEVVVKDSNIEIRFKLTAFPTQALSVTNEKRKAEEASFATMESVKRYYNHNQMSSIFK